MIDVVFPLLIGAFAGIMIPTFMLSVTPTLTVKLLELTKLLQKNEVTTVKEMYIGGEGYAKKNKCYSAKISR